ncbi:3'-5' exonuclease [Hymenobacter wooponensis]|uniref:3'-5' exonuclease n=1 Tax=Hymenobacter wooponensis TaxID=1525360 RepID=UPI001436834A|nr:3'-5' exonuclease [Hymenobacter wooponensis]
MKEYLLFVDTETTGLPQRWNKPYSAERNWPYIAQLAWGVYTPDGELVKAENHYLRVPAGRMQASAVAIHGLTPEFLQEQGQDPRAVLEMLRQDLLTYQPLVVGHYLQLDFHVIGAGFYRAGLENPLAALPTLCTMQLTHISPPQQGRRYLRLGELHEQLFHTPMVLQHDAWADAQATAHCYFEMQRQHLLTEELLQQQRPLQVPPPVSPQKRWPLLAALFTAAILVALYLIYG